MKRIGDILTRYLDAEPVKDDVIYKQVTVKTQYKGVTLRGKKNGSDIGTKNQWKVKPDLFLLSRIDARNGAFGIIPQELDGAIVTNDFMAYEINEGGVDREFFNVFLQSPTFLEACIKASRGNTNRKRVQEEFFLDYEVNLPKLEEQKVLIKKIQSAKQKLEKVSQEITTQEDLLKKLRQAILQEAISGKLTADWRAENPNPEPASALLERIKAEKQKLIAEKKIRKEKPLPDITPEEIPFEIPKSWEWCRFGQTIELISGQHIDAENQNSKRIGMPYITGPSDFGKAYPIVKKWTQHPRAIAKTHYSLITVKGSGVGKMNRMPDFPMAIGRQIMAAGAVLLFQNYADLFLSNEYLNFQAAKTGQIPGISREDILYKIFATPPISEQTVIVEKIESLMTLCDEMDQEIQTSKQHTQDLLQSVLREAFNPS